MNRHGRRAAVAQERVKPDKGKVVLHTDPETVPQQHIALFIATAAAAYSTARKVPGLTFPVHVSIESGGQQICGTVEPADGETGGVPIVDPTTHPKEVH